MNCLHWMLAPRLAVDDPLDLRARESESLRQVHQGRGCAQCADLLDIRARQFSLSVSFSGLQGAVLALIVAVGLTSTPRQILQSVIKRAPIQVTAFAAIWTWTSEGQQHQAVDSKDDRTPVAFQNDLFIFTAPRSYGVRFSAYPRSSHAGISAPAREHVAALVDGVTRETRNGPRSFGWHIDNAITGVRS